MTHSRRHTRLTAGLAAIAIAVGLSAVPAQAASFSFGFGIGPGMYFNDNEGEVIGGTCLTDYSLRKAIARQGYSNIYLGLDNHHHATVKATRGDWVYKLNVNTCSGMILSRERVSRAN